MAHLLRLALILVCLLGFNAARAEVPPIYEGCVVAKPADVPADGTPVGGCGGYGPAQSPLVTRVDPGNESLCQAGLMCNEIGFNPTYFWSRTLICPPSSTKVGGVCVCNADTDQVGGSCVPKCSADEIRVDGVCRPNNPCPEGQHEEGGACVPNACQPDEVRVNGVCVKEPPCPLPGYTRINGQCKKNGCEPGKDMGQMETEGEATSFFCDGGCQVKVNPSTCVRYDGKVSCWGTARQTGATCTPGEGSGSGGNPGTGGGTGGTGGGTGGTGGGTGGTGGGTGGGSDGGGTGGSGGGSGNVPPPDPKPPEEDGGCPAGYFKSGNVCIKNPEPPNSDGACPPGSVKVGTVCRYPEPPSGGGAGGGTGGGTGGGGNGDGEKSGFGGNCQGGWACEGDAIQCAIAREQHARACKLFDDQSPESKLYNDNKGKEGKQTNDLPGNETVNVFGRIDSSDALGAGGSGLSDLNITVWGKAISLPFSMLNSYLAALGNVLLAVSFLIALRIVARG